jgi:hypothetical protein
MSKTCWPTSRARCKVLRPACVAALLALAGCASAPPAPQEPQEPRMALAGDTLTFRGNITTRSYAALMALAGSAPVRTLRIQSGGGEVGNAMAIARWVHRNGIDVVVDGSCFSSCSNYIFQAGREKHIVAGGIVGWHGTVEHLRYLQKNGLQDFPAGLEAAAARERAFYREAGINGYISWFGKIAPYLAPNLYFLSREDMEYFGLRGLHVRADYPDSDLSGFNADEQDTIRLITVDRSVTNPSDPNWIAE